MHTVIQTPTVYGFKVQWRHVHRLPILHGFSILCYLISKLVPRAPLSFTVYSKCVALPDHFNFCYHAKRESTFNYLWHLSYVLLPLDIHLSNLFNPYYHTLRNTADVINSGHTQIHEVDFSDGPSQFFQYSHLLDYS